MDKIKNLNISNVICFFTLALIFLFFSQSLGFSWKHFDEQIIYKETILPCPGSFEELIAYIKHLGIHNLIEASNPFYTTISIIRGSSLDVVFVLFLFYLFQKSAFCFHLFSLCLHLLNSLLCFQILKKITGSNTSKNLILISILTLIWALHPVNIESVVFLTNFGALITYSFCFLFLSFYLNLLNSDKSELFSLPKKIIIFLLYLFPLFLNEYSVTLPLIIFFYVFATKLKNTNKRSVDIFHETLKLISPLLISLMVFITSFIFLPVERFSNTSDVIVSIQRVFWLSPQIFFHFIKLIVFPKTLSIDQSSLVFISNSLFSSYSIFCFTLMFGFILLSLVSFFKLKKNGFYLLNITFLPFFISILPFIHLISPLYNLASERYLYLPSFFMVFGLLHLIQFLNKKRNSIFYIFLLFICLIGLSTRSYNRLLDWKDSISLFTSAYKSANSKLYKGLRLVMVGALESDPSNDETKVINGKNKIIDGANLLFNHLNILEAKIKSSNYLPKIFFYYGIDPKSMQAKTAYLLAYTKLSIDANIDAALNILDPYIQDTKIIDTQILDMYLGLLYSKNNLPLAEDLIKKSLSQKPSPTAFIAQAKLFEMKGDTKSSEYYLNKSFKLFPYDVQTLYYNKLFYKFHNRVSEYAYFTFLYGLRIHSREELQEAYSIYSRTNNTKMTNEILKISKSL